MVSARGAEAPRGARNWGRVTFGAGVAVAALALGAIALDIPVRPVDMVLGPRLFPLAIMIGLAVLGTATAALAYLRPAGSPTDELDAPSGLVDWRALAYIVGGLIAFGAAVETVGFVVAAALLFVAVARGFGSARLVRDIVIALLLAGIVFAVFVYGLGLDLPAPVFLRG